MMRTIIKATLASLLLVTLGACGDSNPRWSARMSVKELVKNTKCQGSALVGAKTSETSKVGATSFCTLTINDFDTGCRLSGTYRDLNLGDSTGTALFTVEYATSGCGEVITPDSINLNYDVDGDEIEFTLDDLN